MNDKGTKKIVEELNNLGFEAYVVGGAVRDYLMNRKINDYDIATSAKPEEVEKLPFLVIPTGVNHGTMTVVVNKISYEVTTYRKETDYLDHRHPLNVFFSTSLIDDLKRRDFTINAMAYDVISDEVIDIFNGKEDLKNRLIRAVGNPIDRFEEDALRILRALRFSSTLNFDIEEDTKNAIKQKYTDLKYISKERINVEITKLLEGISAHKVLNEFPEVFEYIFKVVSKEEVIQASKEIQLSSTNLILRLSIIFKNVNNSYMILKEMKYTNITARIVSNFIESYQMSIDSKKDIFDLITKVKLENMKSYLEFLGLVDYDCKLFSDIESFYQIILDKNLPMTINELDINGDDLIFLGIKGKKIKEVLKKLHELVLFNDLNNNYFELLDKAKYYLQK